MYFLIIVVKMLEIVFMEIMSQKSVKFMNALLGMSTRLKNSRYAESMFFCYFSKMVVVSSSKFTHIFLFSYGCLRLAAQV